MKKLFILLIILSSCASKKNKHIQKEEIKIEAAKDTEIVTKEKEIEVSKEIVAVYEGKENDELTVTEIKNGITTTKTYKGSGKLTESVKEAVKDKEIETQTKVIEDIAVVVKKKEVTKQKEKVNYYWLLLLLIIPAYYIYKKTRIL